MGYRSQVCIAMTDDASRLFRTILDHIPQGHEVHSLIKDADRVTPWNEQHKTPNVDCEDKMYWDYVKWYDGHDDVDFIESFLSDCIPEEDFRLVRVGEENDDTEERGEYWDAEIYVHRSISW